MDLLTHEFVNLDNGLGLQSIYVPQNPGWDFGSYITKWMNNHANLCFAE